MTIPDSVTSIGDSAFKSCSYLTSVTIENPDCEIYDTAKTFYNSYDESTGEYTFTGTIYGYDNSTAQAYAEKYGYTFESLGAAAETDPTEPEPTVTDPTEPEPTETDPTEPHPTKTDPTEPEPTETDPTDPDPTGPEPVDILLGDVNLDNTINAGDAAVTLSAAAQYGATGSYGDMTDAQITAANIDGNESVNASDAAYILQYAAIKGANGKEFDIRELVK